MPVVGRVASLIFLVSAIITPTPDFINLCLFVLPTVGLYLWGVGAAALARRGRGRPTPEKG